jgi:hypothetical protein
MQNEHQRRRNEHKARRFNTFQERTNYALFEGAVAAARKAADVAVRKAMAADAGCGDYDPRYGYEAEHSVAWDAGFEEASMCLTPTILATTCLLSRTVTSSFLASDSMRPWKTSKRSLVPPKRLRVDSGFMRLRRIVV